MRLMYSNQSITRIFPKLIEEIFTMNYEFILPLQMDAIHLERCLLRHQGNLSKLMIYCPVFCHPYLPITINDSLKRKTNKKQSLFQLDDHQWMQRKSIKNRQKMYCIKNNFKFSFRQINILKIPILLSFFHAK